MNDRNNPYFLDPARLDWQDGIPCAKEYGDVYFSRDDGIAESRHVFIDNNALAERWTALDGAVAGRFTICETGFGTGLNFLLAWQLWQQCAPANWTLHYISCEKHPLSSDDLRKAQCSWPSLIELAEILQHNYPPLIPGLHRRLLGSSQICLDLLFGDIANTLPALLDSVTEEQNPSGPVDAWFLDGFAPATNPGMWQPELFETMARLSRPGTSFATFTAAGIVKRGLRDQGFIVNKVRGFGRKRDMLTGHLDATGARQASSALAHTPLPWHQPAAASKPSSVVIIGAGLAGCSSARALAERGLAVTIIERENHIAGAASGNPQGMLYTKLSPDPGTLNLFTLHSFLFALHYYHRIAQHSTTLEGEFCGVLQLPTSEREHDLFCRLQRQLADQQWLRFVSPAQASALSGLDIQQEGIFYPGAGWLSPPSVCETACDHPNIDIITHCEAISLSDDGNTWQVVDRSGRTIAKADAIVIANSSDALQFTQSQYLPLRKIRGQISFFDEKSIQRQPRCVVCHKGYIAPPAKQQLCIGASFDLKNSDCELRDQDHQFNLDTLAALSEGVLKPASKPSGGRAALRCASPDYSPIVGALPNVAAFDNDYAPLRKDARRPINIPGRYLRNCYVNLGHGSRGLTSTPIAAELLASYLCGESRPLPVSLCESLSPARFLIRDLMRGRR